MDFPGLRGFGAEFGLSIFCAGGGAVTDLGCGFSWPAGVRGPDLDCGFSGPAGFRGPDLDWRTTEILNFFRISLVRHKFS